MVSHQGEGAGDILPKIIIPGNVSEFYVNSILVAGTPFDFMLFCGSQILPSSIIHGSTRLRQDTRVDVVLRMSPEYAKITVRNLQEAIDDYESKNGEIHIPKEVADAIAAAKQVKQKN